MSLVPILLNEFIDDELPSILAPLRVGYYRPWRNQKAVHSGISNIQCDKEGFKVNLDVQQFKPDELTVKMVDDFIVVEGKHEEREDEHGFISRQFTRRYKLPKGVDTTAVQSQLSSDGVLTVTVPKKAWPKGSKERIVPIVHTQAPAVKERKRKRQS